jgi:hypothetical protein
MFHRSGSLSTSIRVDFTTSNIVASLLEAGFVNMFFGRHPVKEYHLPQRVTTCFKCHQHGHMAKNCRNNAVCARCGIEHEGLCEVAKLHCVNCEGEHFPGQSVCPEVQKIRQQARSSRTYAQVITSRPLPSPTTIPMPIPSLTSQSVLAPPLDTQIPLPVLVYFDKRFDEMKSLFSEIIGRLTAKLDEQQQRLHELGPVKVWVEKTIRETEEMKEYLRNNPCRPSSCS